MFRRRRDEGPEPEEARGFQREALPQRYTMREQMFDIGEDFWIENEGGERAFKVDGKALRLRNTLTIENPRGELLCEIQAREAHARDSMAIERNDQKIAEVQKDLLDIVHDHFKVNLVGRGQDLQVKGNILDHEYEITQSGHPIAEISKQWLRLRDSYTVDVMPGQDDALVLAITICVDQMASGDAGQS